MIRHVVAWRLAAEDPTEKAAQAQKIAADLLALKGVVPSIGEISVGPDVVGGTNWDVALVADFADAARRAVEAGFDGVQIHAAHCYCLCQFLSPYFNKRTDRYGGSVEKRAQAFVEVYRAVRGVVGKDFPVIAKINAEDFIDAQMVEGKITGDKPVDFSVSSMFPCTEEW